MRSEVPLDLLRNLVAIHIDREVAFCAEPNGRLRILVLQPAESAGGPNGGVRRCSADVLHCREHLLTCFPNRFVRINQPQHCAVAFHQRALALPGKLIQSWRARLLLRRAAGLAFPFHTLVANLVDEGRSGTTQVDDIDIVRD